MKKINTPKLLDAISIIIIIGVFILGYISLQPKDEPKGEPVLLTLTVTRNADIIKKEAQKMGLAYYNSNEYPVKIVSVSPTTIKDEPALAIVLEAKGFIENNTYSFNGQRVLIGQKGEIHGRYFAQGIVSNVRYK